MREDLLSLLYLLTRYLHVIASDMIVGGTLFYELIVPVAIDDLKDGQKLSVFARARWAFRWIVWIGVFTLLASGAVSTYRNWYAYSGIEAALTDPSVPLPLHPTQLEGAGYWWLAHSTIGLAGMTIALALVSRRSPPRFPLTWMRINLIVLLVAIFLASTARHVRLRLIENRLPSSSHPIE